MYNPKILLIDDDPDDCELLNESLNNEGIIECIIVQSAERALQILNEIDDLPDLIILDLYMPKIGGIEFLSKLKNSDRFKNIDVIIYSSSILTVHKKEVLAIGAKEFIQKPVGVAEFRGVVSKILEKFKPVLENVRISDVRMKCKFLRILRSFLQRHKGYKAHNGTIYLRNLWNLRETKL